MPRIRREIPAVKIEYVCDRCERGIYRLVSKKPTTTNYIHKWQHKCTHCGDQADFAVPYPLIEVDGRPVCLLKDKTLKTLQADLVGKLYKTFDPQDPVNSIPPEIEKWLRDKEIITL